MRQAVGVGGGCAVRCAGWEWREGDWGGQQLRQLLGDWVKMGRAGDSMHLQDTTHVTSQHSALHVLHACAMCLNGSPQLPLLPAESSRVKERNETCTSLTVDLALKWSTILACCVRSRIGSALVRYLLPHSALTTFGATQSDSHSGTNTCDPGLWRNTCPNSQPLL